MLFGIHMGLASITSSPEMMIDEKQSQELAAALVNVQSHYEMVVSPETMAWINLGMVATSIYMPKIYMAAQRKKKEKTEAKRKADEAAKADPIYSVGGHIIEGNFTRGPSPG